MLMWWLSACSILLLVIFVVFIAFVPWFEVVDLVPRWLVLVVVVVGELGVGFVELGVVEQLWRAELIGLLVERG